MAEEFKKMVESGKIDEEILKHHAWAGCYVLIKVKDGIDAKKIC
jgi:hypothetical protein